MSGRARARGRARNPPAPAQQQPPRPPGSAWPQMQSGSAPPQQQPRMPGSAPPPQRTMAAGEPSGAVGGNGNGGTGAGRASHRGGARGEQQPGPVASVSTQMARMTMGTGGAGSARGRDRMTYTEPETRPAHIVDKKGEDPKARKLTLITNFYKLEAKTDWAMYQYRIDFSPVIDNQRLAKGLIASQRQIFGTFVFDGTQLFTTRKLENNPTEVVVQSERGENFKIIAKLTNELAPGDPTCLHQFNILLRQCMSDVDMSEVQRCYYDTHAAINLEQHNLTIWPGFKTSILQYEEDVLLNLDVSHKVLRTDSPLKIIQQNFRGNQASGRELCEKALLGEIILTQYNKNKTYRVDDIAWNLSPRDTFTRRERNKIQGKWVMEEKTVNYIEYYQDAYKVRITEPNQPLLVSRLKKKEQGDDGERIVYLVPELCTMTGLTEHQRSNFSLMKDMGAHTRQAPSTRIQGMQRFRERIMSSEPSQKRLESWGTRIGKDLVNVPGKVFEPENILLGKSGGRQENTMVTAGPKASWDNELKGKRLYTAVDLTNWVMIYQENQDDLAAKLFQTLQRVGTPLGMAINTPVRVKLGRQPGSLIGKYTQALEANIKPNVQMVCCILPNNQRDLYSAIKKQCCLSYPVPSQCVTANKLRNDRGLMSIVTKIAVQLNCKLGGEPWAVNIPMKDMMVIGFDTYHDSTKKNRSCGGFVASLNNSLTRYFSQTCFQSQHEELVRGLQAMYLTALKKYHAVNNTLPKRVVVYRDGVGDGQLSAVVQEELKKMLGIHKQLGQDYNPEFVFIVVKKRINTKFMTLDNRRQPTNPPPGTVVDSVVTRREWFDFFLVPQSVGQGTVTPTHYNVIWHFSAPLTPVRIQKLTYKLCHLYFNWPGTVRVPAPCQYAHKLAFLAGQYLHKDPDPSLADKLYYL